jgi:hypothetical protein
VIPDEGDRFDRSSSFPHLLTEVKSMCETAGQVGYALGRKEAAGEIRSEIAALPTHHPDGLPLIARDIRHAAAQIARRVWMGESTQDASWDAPQPASNGLTASSRHPGTPEDTKPPQEDL